MFTDFSVKLLSVELQMKSSSDKIFIQLRGFENLQDRLRLMTSYGKIDVHVMEKILSKFKAGLGSTIYPYRIRFKLQSGL